MKTETQELTGGRDIAATLGWMEKLAEEYIARGDRAECDKAGKNLAAMVTTPQWASMASGLAAILEKFREDYRATFLAAPQQMALPLEPKAAAAPAIPQGTFTVEFPDGDYRTVELETVAEGKFAGRTIASYLSGPDNERDFRGFAFVNVRGDGLPTVAVWRRFADIDERWREAAYIAASANREGQLGMAEAYAHRSSRCARCGHKLTVPASLHRGYGPDCAAVLGII